MTHILLFIDLFRKGAAVADPHLLQDRGKLAIALSAFLTAAAHIADVLGYGFPLLDTATVDQLAGGIAAAAYLIVHYTGSTDHGFLPAKPVDGLARDGATSGEPHDPAPVGSGPTLPQQPDPMRSGPAEDTGPTGTNMP